MKLEGGKRSQREGEKREKMRVELIGLLMKGGKLMNLIAGGC